MKISVMNWSRMARGAFASSAGISRPVSSTACFGRYHAAF